MEGQNLGDYTIIKKIGHGALGCVYLSEHRFMKRQYILKVLPEELASDRAFIQRFEEEVSHLSALEHPHIIKIHNISHADGRYFLVSDCVVDEMGEITNLAQYMMSQDKRLPEEELLRLLKQVADALDYAHSKKLGEGGSVIHRGLKLNNILVSKSGGGADLYITDFGLSRIIGPGAVLSRTYKTVAEVLGVGNTLTASLGSDEHYPSPPIDDEKLKPLHASFLQTFAFLAPEQKRLDYPKPVTIKTDSYAFGILAYFMIVGEFPEGCFEMPSALVSEYRWNWDQLIRSCLHTDPDRRSDQLSTTLNNVCNTIPAPSVAPQQSLGTLPHPTAETLVTPVPEPELVTVEPPPQQAECVATVKAPEPQQLRPVFEDTQLERPVNEPDPAAIFDVDHSVKHYVPEKKIPSETKPLMTDMVVIKGGTFSRGSNDGNRDEIPRHQVSVDSFAIDTHPITNDQFVRFLEVLGGVKDSNHLDVIRLKDSRVKRSAGKWSIESGYSKHPVVGVTWYGAVAYAKWVGKRLPTEAEWELAAKGGNNNAFYATGEDLEKSQANFFSSDSTAVMSYAPNGFGLYDMAGNVYEWCQDWYGYNYYETSVQEPDSPTGPLQGVYRVLRGGCWKSLKEDLRCSRRHRNNPGTVNGTYGFRCATNVE